MALVECPECKKDISEYTENCPNCGFPLQKFMREHNIYDITKALICPKCARCISNDWAIKLKCEYCKTPLIQTDISMKEMNSFRHTHKDREINERFVKLAQELGRNQFDQNAYEYRLQEEDREIAIFLHTNTTLNSQSQQSNQPKCPTCGSTNIEKISTAKKAAGGFMFGLFSKTARSQFMCKDCGYKW